jgi:glycosyltransferase involved in cell wall biosynthesis
MQKISPIFQKALFLLKFSIVNSSVAFRYLANHGLIKFLQALKVSVREVWLSSSNLPGLIPVRERDLQDLLVQATVLVISGDVNSPSHSYRVENFVTAFRNTGERAVWIGIHEAKQLKFMPNSIKLVIFWRTNVTLSGMAWSQSTDSLKLPLLVYDTDDLTFDDAVYTVDNVHGLLEIGSLERDFLLNTLPKQQANQIREMDVCTSATPRMAESFSKLGKKSIDVPIVIPRWMEIQSSLLWGQRGLAGTEPLNIVYASGTRSHGKDFLSAWPSLVHFLLNKKMATLTVLGDSPLDKALVPFELRDRVLFKEKVRHEDLLPTLFEYDLQIAPLELQSPFVQAKSATKFMQAASLGIPTIASPTTPFLQAITHGENGWLASDYREWIEALELASNPETLRKVGESARSAFVQNHRVENILSSCEMLIGLAEAKREKQRGIAKQSIQKVFWVLQDLPAASGGHRNILRLANYLQKKSKKYSSVIMVVNHKGNATELGKFAKEKYGYDNLIFSTELSEISHGDIVFATYYKTVDVVKQFSSPKALLCYLVQDFESLFFPMGDEYIRARESYADETLNIICSGEWMSLKILETTGRNVPFFRFPIDSAVYHVGPTREREGVVFFAKSDTPRRLYELGMETLSVLSNWHPNLPITLFGGAKADRRVPSPNISNLGKLESLEELGDIYRRAKVGIAFSSTNPSLVPYEMMACGLPVVDVKLRDDPIPKFHEPNGIVFGNPNPFDLATAASLLLDNPSAWEKKSLSGLQLAGQMPDEDEIGGIIERFLEGLS